MLRKRPKVERQGEVCEWCMHAAHWDRYRGKIKVDTAAKWGKVHLVARDESRSLCWRADVA